MTIVPAQAAGTVPTGLEGPAGAVTRAAFVDIDEKAAALDGWHHDDLQLSPGSFRGEVRRLHLDGVALFIEDLQRGAS